MPKATQAHLFPLLFVTFSIYFVSMLQLSLNIMYVQNTFKVCVLPLIEMIQLVFLGEGHKQNKTKF